MEQDERLDTKQQRTLLAVARRAVASQIGALQTDPVEVEDLRLQRPGGAFVTLRRLSDTGEQPALRGCIGTFEEDQPLVQAVEQMAVMAATRDPRFPPVRSEELTRLTIEISVLSPRRGANAEDLVVGRDGVCLTYGARRGVLLPQVAVEYGWDRETFLEQTCRKAGLPPGSWRDSAAELELFSAQVFSEDEFPGQS
jgi:AmmeMemoRadiSam system protein A